MAKREERKIRVVAYVHVGEELVDVDTLSREQRVRLGTKIKCGWFNEIMRGKAEAFVPGIVEPSPAALAGIPVEL